MDGHEVEQQRHVSQAADGATLVDEARGAFVLTVDQRSVELHAQAVVEVVAADELGDGAVLVLVRDVGHFPAAELSGAEERVLLGGREVETTLAWVEWLGVEFLIGGVATAHVTGAGGGGSEKGEQTNEARNFHWERREGCKVGLVCGRTFWTGRESGRSEKMVGMALRAVP